MKKVSMAGLIIVLFVICVVTSLLLGLVNEITEDRIAEITAENTRLAMQEVLNKQNA